uniref:Secreted protein n=1 Tax=Eutreptiella gymnastica TaxID=73025 RepID=A0A6T2H7Q6_9EUGL
MALVYCQCMAPIAWHLCGALSTACVGPSGELWLGLSAVDLCTPAAGCASNRCASLWGPPTISVESNHKLSPNAHTMQALNVPMGNCPSKQVVCIATQHVIGTVWLPCIEKTHSSCMAQNRDSMIHDA